MCGSKPKDQVDQTEGRPKTVDRRSRQEPSGWSLVGTGIEFSVVVAIMAALGGWLDQKFSTEPWLLLALMGIGLIGGTYKLWLVGKRFFE